MPISLLPSAGLLPAGVAPATVWFEASRANLLRHGSVSCYLEEDRPRATELLLTPPLLWRPAVDSGRWPGVARNMRDTDTGLGESAAHGSKMPHLESHQDLRFQRPSCYCCTTGQMLRMAVKVAWPDYPKGNRTTIYWRCFIPMASASETARRRVPGSFPRLHRNQVSARECILYS
jgi:hypothetical protein